MITSYVPGRVVGAQDWDDALLNAHAWQLAALHATPFAAAGEVTAAEQDRAPCLSLSARFAESIEWWRDAHPDVLADADVARLVPAVERHMAEAEPAFSRLRRFALVHGDLVVPNVLVDAGTPSPLRGLGVGGDRRPGPGSRLHRRADRRATVVRPAERGAARPLLARLRGPCRCGRTQ